MILAVTAATLWTGLAFRRLWWDYHSLMIFSKEHPEQTGVDPAVLDSFFRSTRADPVPVFWAYFRRPWRGDVRLGFNGADGPAGYAYLDGQAWKVRIEPRIP